MDCIDEKKHLEEGRSGVKVKGNARGKNKRRVGDRKPIFEMVYIYISKSFLHLQSSRKKKNL